MKKYLLICGEDYYPDFGTNDWVKCFETEQEAKDYMLEKSIKCDWFKIVNLEDWMNDSPYKELK